MGGRGEATWKGEYEVGNSVVTSGPDDDAVVCDVGDKPVRDGGKTEDDGQRVCVAIGVTPLVLSRRRDCLRLYRM